MFGKIIQRFKKQAIDAGSIQDALNLYKKGLKWSKLGRYNEALQELKRSAAINPTQALTFFQLGFGYFKLNRFSEAKNAYQKFLDLDANLDLDSYLDVSADLDFEAAKVEVYTNLGIIHETETSFVKAIGFYQSAIRIKRKNPVALNNLGATYFKMGIYPEAIKAHEQVLSFKPDDVTAHYRLGLIYLDLKDRSLVVKESEILKDLDQSMAADLADRLHRLRY